MVIVALQAGPTLMAMSHMDQVLAVCGCWDPNVMEPRGPFWTALPTKLSQQILTIMMLASYAKVSDQRRVLGKS